MKAKELIKWIQDNDLENYDIYCLGETPKTCWVPNLRLCCVVERDGYYEDMYHIEENGNENAIVI